MKVAILGAGGLTGQFLVGALHERGVETRAVLRRQVYTERLPVGVETAVANFEDVEALSNALLGCDAVYLIPPSFNPGEELFAANTIEAMAGAGVKRCVYHSVLHPSTPDMPHHWRKSKVELLIRESDLQWTVLQPAMYVQTVLSFLSENKEHLSPPFNPDQPFNLMAPSDLVDAVVRVLSGPDTAYATLELAGCEQLSIRQMAAQLSSALGKSISVEVADVEETVAGRALKRGWSEAQQAEYRAMLKYYDRFGLPGNGLTLEMLLGRSPTSFVAAAQALLRT